MIIASFLIVIAAIGIVYLVLRGSNGPRASIVDVIGAMDGRTIEVLIDKQKERVILAGIGFPPGDQKSENDCAEVVQEVIVGRRLYMEVCQEVAGCKYVLLKSANGDCINTMMLAKGMARYETTGIGYVGQLVEAENRAKATGAGVWDKNRALFRHIAKDAVTADHYAVSAIDEYASERD